MAELSSGERAGIWQFTGMSFLCSAGGGAGGVLPFPPQCFFHNSLPYLIISISFVGTVQHR
jgi:hypothetical protein